MQLFFKRAGCLLFMVVLGFLMPIFLLRGYPFSWRVTADYVAYWMPIALTLDSLCLFAALALILWGLRGFLFGRGRPWLAWFSIGFWVLVWLSSIWAYVRDGEVLWGTELVVSDEAQFKKVAALEQQPWSLGDVRNLPKEQRWDVCSKAVMEEEARAVAEREGFPIHVHFPQDMADKGLFDTDACPAELVGQYKKLSSLSQQLRAALGEQASESAERNQRAVDFNMKALHELAGHPETFARLAELKAKPTAEAIEGVIELKELQWRVVSNGQLQDHAWEELPGPGHVEEVSKTFFDPRIWQDDEDSGGDAWNFWIRLDRVDGRTDLMLLMGDCSRRTETVKLLLSKLANGQHSMIWVGGGTNQAKPGSSFDRWLQKACASKDQQARLPVKVSQPARGS